MLRVGVEVEISTNWPDLMPKIAGWRVGSDGSISPEGVEYKFYGGVTPPTAFKRVEKLCMALQKLEKEFEIEANSSCGLHIHVDAKKLSVGELCSINANFNPLCLQLTKMFNVLPSRLRSWCYRNDLLPLSATAIITKSYQNRYRMLNFASLSRHGSIEYRLFNGTTNKEKIKAYIEFVVKLTERLKKSGISLVYPQTTKHVVDNFNTLAKELKLTLSCRKGLFLQLTKFLKDKNYVLVNGMVVYNKPVKPVRVRPTAKSTKK